MPVRIHALVVVRPESADRGEGAARQLARTLGAISAQDRPVDALTIVVCGDGPPALRDVIASSGAEGVIAAPRSTGFAAALALATLRVDQRTEAVWLLAHDTEPERDALARLAGSLEQPSVWIAAPKLVRRDESDTIVSLGVSMTRLGRTVGLVDGQHDQGQHDADNDALASDIRGVLVRRGAWDLLGGIDPALAGADEGLDLGVRARLAGGRLALVPAARVEVVGPAVLRGAARRRAAYARRVAQLHRRLAYAPAAAVAVLWLSILPLVVWRTILLLVRKEPGEVLPEWAAAATVLVRLPSIAASRRRIRATSRRSGTRVSWSQLAPLRVTRAELKRRFDTEERSDGPDHRGELGFFTTGGAWAVLGAAVLGAVVFVGLLAWPTLGGGGLLPLRDAVGALWSDAAYGTRALGLDVVGPADPFAAVIALLGSLTPWNPSQAVVILWVVSFPLAMLGAWVAASRLTSRPGLRIAAGIAWMLAPTFVTALVEGRPAAVLVHLLLPWLVIAAVSARHSWAAAGAASLLGAAVLACAPSLAPALILLWVGLLGRTLAVAPRRVLRVVWMLVPTAALFAPLVWRRGIREGEWIGLLADPGVVFAAPQAGPDAAGRGLLAMGLPTPDLVGWAGVVPALAERPWIVGLALAPLALLALLSLVGTRFRIGGALIAIAGVGLAAAFAQSLISIQFAAGEPVALWPGTGLSLAWLGVVGAATVAADAPATSVVRALQPWAAAVAVAGVVAVSAPGLAAPLRGEAALTNGPASSLPAFVAAAGSAQPSIGTLVVAPLPDGAVSARVVWGGSETLGGQTTLLSTRAVATAGDERLASLTADLVVPSAVDIAAELAREGISFVLLAPPTEPASGAATALALRAEVAIDERAGFESVGETGRGVLWRVGEGVEPVRAEGHATARTIALVQLAIVAIAVLLAIPTRASRQEARRRPRLWGAAPAALTVEAPPDDPDVVTETDEAEAER